MNNISVALNFGYQVSNNVSINRKVTVEGQNGILLLFWLTVRKNCSKDREKLLKFEAESREFTNILRSLEQFI